MLRSRTGWVGVVMGMVACGTVWAAPADIHENHWELGPEIYYARYREPDVDVTFEGPMYGLVGAFTHHQANRWALKADGRVAVGQVDYTGSGTLNGIPDYALEGRLTAGYDMAMGAARLLTPFVGLGYRYLNDDSSGKTSSTGAKGYDRESNYLYSPLGVECNGRVNDQWQIGATVEYDLFWKGWQKSHLDDANPAFNTLSNDQNHGYGLRGSIKVRRAGDRVDLVIEPYLRWWSIGNSQNANITYAGVIVGYGYEPKNETLEAGANVTVRF